MLASRRSNLRRAVVALFFAGVVNGLLTAPSTRTGTGQRILIRAPRSSDRLRPSAVSEISQQMNDVRAQMEEDEKTKIMMQALRCGLIAHKIRGENAPPSPEHPY
jgi:hypothetical protein